MLVLSYFQTRHCSAGPLLLLLSVQLGLRHKQPVFGQMYQNIFYRPDFQQQLTFLAVYHRPRFLFLRPVSASSPTRKRKKGQDAANAASARSPHPALPCHAVCVFSLIRSPPSSGYAGKESRRGCSAYPLQRESDARSPSRNRSGGKCRTCGYPNTTTCLSSGCSIL